MTIGKTRMYGTFKSHCHCKDLTLSRQTHLSCNLILGWQDARNQKDRSEGGLSKAFKAPKARIGDDTLNQAKTGDQQPGSEGLPRAAAESLVLGRSPSRGHVSANHLLNFQQYQPQQV